MAEVKILIEGYAKPTGSDSYKASPTTVLIKDSKKLILVDPGANKKKLIAALKKEKIKINDIDIIFLTHYHIDHLLNIRLFPNTDVYAEGTIYRDDIEISFEKKIPKTNISMISTPGHSEGHVSLLADTNQGKVCIAGDLWWWKDNVKQKLDKKSLLNLQDPFSKDKKSLKESRKKILKMADYIIPGHGKMFKVI